MLFGYDGNIYISNDMIELLMIPEKNNSFDFKSFSFNIEISITRFFMNNERKVFKVISKGIKRYSLFNFKIKKDYFYNEKSEVKLSNIEEVQNNVLMQTLSVL